MGLSSKHCSGIRAHIGCQTVGCSNAATASVSHMPLQLASLLCMPSETCQILSYTMHASSWPVHQHAMGMSLQVSVLPGSHTGHSAGLHQCQGLPAAGCSQGVGPSGAAVNSCRCACSDKTVPCCQTQSSLYTLQLASLAWRPCMSAKLLALHTRS